MIDTVLIVCEGNLCRSPIAQGLLQRELTDVVIRSAGLSATKGASIDPIALELLALKGIDMSEQRARRIDERMCSTADLILVMELAQKQAIERFYPIARGRVYRMAEAERMDVPDPYGRQRRVYEQAITLIERGVGDWTQRIVDLSRSRRS
ncbi:Low molecular weight protein-tyrosine-phosphatase Ptp [Paraburkholderia domus]|uniref:low molecular weight protein-tyrosine-phosphatase n=1 Tax=Paraburkholderia domus TaxID=2793075 RepID=UPI0019122D55|nr:low molecular weight protein-tyrosine-phosphatase [Paraburkholderia domus]MBK5085340.1 low molecular weight phosphotyrosine protein phosphatase [Burkholderia sp. R-69927]CAE6770652.1 Low molecular weight protein-tyrosine-phosphatase Ptp [Paraburkholderia domus]CAE6828486.1 Low molecular weight protein-tyrosine-phosphatase Ptp [Paraburkholderia domus]CAE6871124.1 Low molecular weight protein-tyrosine-phosphatase Ptp [Paraburkholderia domus]